MPGARAAVDVARVSGQVVFLSDTPMPGWFLRELLERSGLWQEGDRVYCSADRVSKTHGGGLYDVAARDLGIATAQIRHTGDNLFSDVAEARLRGVVATTTAAGRRNRYESILEREAVVSDHLASHLAGASRLARLRAGAEGIEPVLAAGAAGVAAPLLVGFAVWLAHQAEQHGLRRLHFVARDGESHASGVPSRRGRDGLRRGRRPAAPGRLGCLSAPAVQIR